MKSETGSGKTLAYLLPVLADLLSLQPPVTRTQGTFAIILAPTRCVRHSCRDDGGAVYLFICTLLLCVYVYIYAYAVCVTTARIEPIFTDPYYTYLCMYTYIPIYLCAYTYTYTYTYRELCSQIADVVDRLTKCCVSIVGGCITGGARRKSEKARLRKGML